MEGSPLFPAAWFQVRRALERRWSAKTSACYNPKIAPVSYGQCAATAIVICETFGGEILRSEIVRNDGTTARHFYNRISGQRLDFTEDQLNMSDYWSMPQYLDLPSSIAEAQTELMPGQLDAMRSAFRAALASRDADEHSVGEGA